MTTSQIILTDRPKGTPEPKIFQTRTIDLPSPKTGEVQLKALYFSVDPYMRGRMNDVKSYTPPFAIGEPLNGGVVAEVVASSSELLKPGDVVLGHLPWQQQMVVPDKGLKKIDTTLAPASYYLGILGMPGLTAYFGLMHIGKPKAGETVVVSGAAGAVGVVVGQLAKIQGCFVVGIAGSDEKLRLLKEEFGFDEAINYKTIDNIKEAIAAACPKGVDIYFDNVGGEISDAVIANINFHARIPLCGQIALYNATEPQVGPRIQPMLLTRSVLMQGFIVGNYTANFNEGIQYLAGQLQQGRLKFIETIVDGFDRLPEALLGLFKGENVGKMIVKA